MDTVEGKVILMGKAKDTKSKKMAYEIALLQVGKEFTVENQIVVKSN